MHYAACIILIVVCFAKPMYYSCLECHSEGHRSFYVVTGAATCTRDRDHILTEARARGISDFAVEDVTDSKAVLAVMGPESRAVMCRAFPATDFATSAFPFGIEQFVI